MFSVPRGVYVEQSEAVEPVRPQCRQAPPTRRAHGLADAPMNGQWSSDLSWDTRVVYIERHRRWWWNAWLASTETELYGFASSREEAARAMYQAIENAARSKGETPR
jgi:hypothetical protein